MKILLVTRSFPRLRTEARDGIETYVETLARVLVHAGTDVHVVEYGARSAYGEPTLPVPIVTVKFAKVPLLSAVLPNLLEAWQLYRTVKRLDDREHFDVIEGANDQGMMTFIASAFGSRFWMHLHVSFRQQTEMNHKKLTWSRRFTAWLDRLATRRALNLATHSRAHAEAAAAEYGIEGRRIAIVPHAVVPPAEIAPPQEIRTVAYIGALDLRKGIDLFLKAAARVARRQAGIEFLVIGCDPEDGEWPPDDESEAETPNRLGTWKSLFSTGCHDKGVESKVHFLGAIDDQELARLWPTIDLVVVPSRYESFGLVAIEAFAWGKPLVATKCGALPEVTAGCASMVDPDPEAIAVAILAIARDPDRAAQLSREGRRLYETRYTLDALQTTVLGLYSMFPGLPPQTSSER